MAHICNKCNKNYSSYKSLWYHNYKYHKDNKKNTEEKIINQMKAQDTNCICDKCDKTFKNLDDIKNHLENDCRPSIKSNNIYTFKTDTLGKYKYKNFKGGDIYIVQTEFNLKGFYKIGISTDLYNRLKNYRSGAVLEPKLHYYYPCKNIKETDKLLKEKLKKFNIKREIYKADNINDIRNIIKEIQKESESDILEIVPENKECDITPCNYCDLYFTNRQDYKNHMNTSHKINLIKDNMDKEINSNFNCNFCNKLFTTRQAKSRHQNHFCEDKNEDNINKKIKDLIEIIVELKKDNELIKENLKILNNKETKHITL